MGQAAGWGRRVIALLVDWLACYVVAAAFLHRDPWGVLVLFGVEQLLSVGTIGASPGHALVGLAVRTAVRRDERDPGLPGPLRALVRTVLLLLVVPPLVFDGAGTGLHDRLVGTRVERRAPRGR